MNTSYGYRFSTVARALVGALLVTGTAAAEPLKIVLPTETASFRTNPGAEYAMGRCLQCHSAEYISTQPLLSRDAWKASIEKMRKKYGATVPEEIEGALLDYLVNTYGKLSPDLNRK